MKLTPCLTITELVCKSNEKNTLLPFAITSLIQLLEDADSNSRLVIDECLNKIIRVGIVDLLFSVTELQREISNESNFWFQCSIDNSNHVAKILIALLKVLGKGTNERCLRAALWRFGKLAHYIRLVARCHAVLVIHGHTFMINITRLQATERKNICQDFSTGDS